MLDSEHYEFINKIKSDIDKGYRFTPFVGSGLSRQSGILMGIEFAEYLAYVVYLCVAPKDERPNSRDFPNSMRVVWDIHSDGWPAIPTPEQNDIVQKWIIEKYIKICEEVGIKLSHVQGRGLKWKIDAQSEYESKEHEIKSFRPSHLQAPLLPEIIAHLDDSGEIQQLGQQLIKFYSKVDSQHRLMDFIPEPGNLMNSSEYAVEAGIRALYDWRATIRFLARLSFKEGFYEFSEQPEQSIIDSFNNHLVWHKKPNLAHYMLASLARPLRIRTILTTNFDTLIEDAFDEIGLPLSELSVGVQSELPDPNLVNSENTIIKLHGSSLNTRADFSLDIPPSYEDMVRFCKYLQPEPNDKTKFVPSKLLVMGFSGRDKRVVELLKYTMMRNKKDFHIYWVYYSDKDKELLLETFKSQYQSQITTIKITRPDLFLFELYQKTTLSLPAAGFSYEVEQNVPPNYHNPFLGEVEESLPQDVGSESPENGEVTFEKNVNDIANVFTSLNKIPKFEPNHEFKFIKPPNIANRSGFTKTLPNANCGLYLLIDSQSGLSRHVSRLYLKLTEKKLSCVWFELEDSYSPQALASKVLSLIAGNKGIQKLEHIFLDVKDDSSFEEDFEASLSSIIELTDISPGKWVFLLYGRGGPGGCSGWDNKYWNEENYIKLAKLIDCLRCFGFNIIYMPYSAKRYNRDKSKYHDELARYERELALQFTKAPSSDAGNSAMNSFEFFSREGQTYACKVHKDCQDTINKVIQSYKEEHNARHTFPEIIKRVVNKFVGNEQGSEFDSIERGIKLQLLYAATLFRQSRHSSAFFTEAAFSCPEKFNTKAIDNDYERSRYVVDILDLELQDKQLNESERLFHLKPGGAAWMYRDIRLGVQRLFQKQCNIDFGDGRRFDDFIGQRRARTHFWIGDWYKKFFRASNHPKPVIESIYHRIACINFLKFAKPSSLNLSNRQGLLKVAQYRVVLFQEALTEIIKCLKLARDSLQFWMHDSYGVSLFDRETFFGSLDIELNNLPSQSAHANDVFFINYDWLLGKLLLPDEYERLRRYYGELFESKPITTRHSAAKMTDVGEWRGYAKKEYFHQSISSLIVCLDSELQHVRTSLKGAAGQKAKFKTNLLSYNQYYFRLPFPKTLACNLDDYQLTDIHRESWQSVVHKFELAALQVFDNLHHCSANARIWFAKKKISKFFKSTGFPRQPMLDEFNPNDNQEIIELKQHVLGVLGGDHHNVLVFVQILCGYANALTVRAKLLTKLDTFEKSIIDKFWVGVCACCWLGTECLFLLHPDFLPKERVLKLKLLQFYGLALAQLGRYYEAHRRLNESTSFIKGSFENDKGSNQALIRLRRTEAHLLIVNSIEELRSEVRSAINSLTYANKRRPDSITVAEVERAFKQQERKLPCWAPQGDKHTYLVREFLTDLDRLRAVKLDDAIVSLEAAERGLAIYDRTNILWGHLYLLKLQIIRKSFQSLANDDDKYKSILHIRPSDYLYDINQIFAKGWLLSSNDPYRKLRLIHEYIEAITSLSVKKDGKNKDAYSSLTRNFIKRGLDFSRLALSEGDSASNSVPDNVMFEKFVTGEGYKFNEQATQYLKEVYTKLKEHWDFDYAFRKGS